MKLSKLVAGAALAIGLMGATSASALTTYTYTGNDFTSTFGNADKLVIEFDVNDPFQQPISFFNFTPVRLSVSDGDRIITLDNLSPRFLDFMIIALGPDGLPSQWILHVSCDFRNNCKDDYYSTKYGVSVQDRSTRYATDNSEFRQASVRNNPGTWSISTPAAVPEPATWAMMIGGFGAAGSMIRRRKSVVA